MLGTDSGQQGKTSYPTFAQGERADACRASSKGCGYSGRRERFSVAGRPVVISDNMSPAGEITS
jgi:hypothetical protein